MLDYVPSETLARKNPSERLALAFNQGCDARLAGRPLGDCPYGEGQDAVTWRAGWHDVEWFFGKLAHWPVRKVPAVREANGAAR